MINYIIYKPITSSVLLIISHEIFFQYHMFIYLYILLTYFTLKVTGLNKPLKTLCKTTLTFVKGWLKLKLPNKAQQSSKVQEELNVTVKNSDGTVDVLYTYNRNGVKYLVSCNKSKDNVTIKVIDTTDNKVQPVVFQVKSFYVNKESVERFLDQNLL